jgi:hypothetical protein
LVLVSEYIEEIVRQSCQAAEAVRQRRRRRTASARNIEGDNLDIFERCRHWLDQLQIFPDPVEDEKRRQPRGSSMDADPQQLVVDGHGFGFNHGH